MHQHETAYRWTARDKQIYALSLLPFLVGFIGSLVLLATLSPALPIIVLGLFLLGNVFQARCCVGCPYRGQYCPALFGVYLGNVLSVRLYREATHDPRLFKINATLGELTVLGLITMAAILLATLNVWYMVILLLLMAAHVLIFLRLICPRCGYNQVCPSGQTACRLFKRWEAPPR